MSAFNLADLAKGASLGLDGFLKDVSGAANEGLVAGARVLRTEIKRVLSVPGTESQPAPPGAPPHRLTTPKTAKATGRDVAGSLYRSIGIAREGDALRVGSRLFTARLLEEGAGALAPHPFMERALEAAAPALEDALVGTLQKRIGTGGSFFAAADAVRGRTGGSPLTEATR